MMTYGEAWQRAKEESQSLDRKFDDCVAMCEFKHKKRMPRKEADTYYKNKISYYFDSKLTVSDFDSVEDYYGYFEAKKLLRAK